MREYNKVEVKETFVTKHQFSVCFQKMESIQKINVCRKITFPNDKRKTENFGNTKK